MRFAAITLGVGLAGLTLAANLQPELSVSGDGLPADVVVVVDPTVTGAVAPAPSAVEPDAVRLIDLRSGASCKTETPPETHELRAAPLGPDCAGSPSLSRIVYWRATPGGSLIMADNSGRRVLEFAPGDGVLFESVYPASELITIVPARG